jgi:hypothetical protein
MACAILSLMYGRDTRPAQILNTLVSVLWVVLLLIQEFNIEAVNIPASIQSQIATGIWLCALAVVFACLGLLTHGRPHQIFKTFALLLGALHQAIIANGYVTEYPPLDIQLVVSTVLSVWFMLAVLYVLRCEGINAQ